MNELRPDRGRSPEIPWMPGSIQPGLDRNSMMHGWVRFLPAGWVEFVGSSYDVNPTMPPTVQVFSPAALLVVVYTGEWETDQ